MYRAVDDLKKIKFYKKLSKYIISNSDYIRKKEEILNSLNAFMFDERKFLAILKKFCEVKADYHKECDNLLNEASSSINLQLLKLDTNSKNAYLSNEEAHYNQYINQENSQSQVLPVINLANTFQDNKESKPIRSKPFNLYKTKSLEPQLIRYAKNEIDEERKNTGFNCTNQTNKPDLSKSHTIDNISSSTKRKLLL